MRVSTGRKLLQEIQSTRKHIGRAWSTAMLGFIILAAGLALRFTIPKSPQIFVPINLIGIFLGVGGVLFALKPRIIRVSDQNLRRSLRWAWRTGALGLLLIELGGIIQQFDTTLTIGEYIAATGFSCLLIFPWISYAVSSLVISPGIVTTLALLALSAATIFTLPPFLIYLATNGASLVPFLGPTINGPVGYVADNLLIVVAGLVVIIPDFIYRRHRWGDVGEDLREYISTWIAGTATVVTATYGILLHFSDGPLARLPWSQIVIGNLVAAVFLRSFYKWVIVACWKSGIVGIFRFDPWRPVQKEAWTLVKETWISDPSRQERGVSSDEGSCEMN